MHGLNRSELFDTSETINLVLNRFIINPIFPDLPQNLNWT